MRVGTGLRIAQLLHHLAQVAVGLQPGNVFVGRHEPQLGQIGLQMPRPSLCTADGLLQALQARHIDLALNAQLCHVVRIQRPQLRLPGVDVAGNLQRCGNRPPPEAADSQQGDLRLSARCDDVDQQRLTRSLKRSGSGVPAYHVRASMRLQPCQSPSAR